MRRLSPGLVALALAAVGAVPVRAADMAPPSYYPPAVLPPAVYDWTGFYLGGNLGAGLLEDKVSQTATTAKTTNLIGSPDVSVAGFIGGAQIGVNYESAPWVIGAEASWTNSAITGSGITSATGGTVKADQERINSAPLWFGTATGRIGYAANDLLFYVKGGGAWMDVEYTENQLTAVGLTAFSQLIHDHRTGFTAGVGLEYGLTENWSAKLEYDFFDFGTTTYQFTQTPVSINSSLNTLIFGVNYRFNWAGGWH